MPITIEQYQRMIEEGIVPEDSTIELLRGLLVRKDRGVLGEDLTYHASLHVMIVSLITRVAARINSDSCHLNVQLPVLCPPDSAPEPDGSIVRGTPHDYVTRIPVAADVSCVIEAAHSSLERDREDKLPIYAAAAIAQYVLVNLQNNTIEVHTDPDPATETYRSKATLERGQPLTLRLPGPDTMTIDAAELLPSPPAIS